LEYLRRGGRIGAAAALVGSALAVKPLLAIDDGRVVVREKVRTATRALARLEEIALEAARQMETGDGPAKVEVVVAHLAASDRAEQLAAHLHEHLGDVLVGEIRMAELGAALGAHVGPGLIAACVTPAL
jgi:DegV family protein with EDD domain